MSNNSSSSTSNPTVGPAMDSPLSLLHRFVTTTTTTSSPVGMTTTTRHRYQYQRPSIFNNTTSAAVRTRMMVSPEEVQKIVDDPEQFRMIQEKLRKRRCVTNESVRSNWTSLLQEHMDEMKEATTPTTPTSRKSSSCSSISSSSSSSNGTSSSTPSLLLDESSRSTTTGGGSSSMELTDISESFDSSEDREEQEAEVEVEGSSMSMSALSSEHPTMIGGGGRVLPEGGEEQQQQEDVFTKMRQQRRISSRLKLTIHAAPSCSVLDVGP